MGRSGWGSSISAALKPNRVALLGPGVNTDLLAARHGTTAAGGR